MNKKLMNYWSKDILESYFIGILEYFFCRMREITWKKISITLKWDLHEIELTECPTDVRPDSSLLIMNNMNDDEDRFLNHCTFQHFVGPPSAKMRSKIRSWRELYKFWIILISVLVHSSSITFLSWFFDSYRPPFAYTLLASIPNRFSIRLSFRLLADQSRILILWLPNHFIVEEDQWIEALSCWKIQLSPSIIAAIGRRCNSKTSWYILEFILPSMKAISLRPL